MSNLSDLQAAMSRLGNQTRLAKTGRVAMSEALHGLYQSARFGSCPDLPTINIPIFVDSSFGDCEFKMLKGRKYLSR